MKRGTFFERMKQMRKFKYDLTVIVPSYNNDKYISQTIESILNQERKFSLRIIICDDGSVDNSVNIIKRYVEEYPEIVEANYSDVNRGLYENYLLALERLDSEFFCVLDPDDYYTDARHLQRAYDFLKNNSDYTIYCENFYAIHDDGSKEKKYYIDMQEGEWRDSTFDDWLNQKAYFTTTLACTYRNCIFKDGIPEKMIKLVGKDRMDQMPFRADSFRNVMHLHEGKARFVNNFVANLRMLDSGLYQKKSDFEKSVYTLWFLYNMNVYYEEQYEEKMYKQIYNAYEKVMEQIKISIQEEKYFQIINEKFLGILHLCTLWLKQKKALHKYQTRVIFSLEKFSDIANKKVFYWGTGTGAEKTIEKYHISLKDNDMFVDGNVNKHGMQFMGKTICSPSEIKKEESDYYIVILSSFHLEIIEQIINEKLCDIDRIIDMFEVD